MPQVLEFQRQDVESMLLHTEQETQRLQDWAQILLELTDRFEGHLRQLSALAAVEEPASLSAFDEPLPVEEEATAVATARPPTDPTEDINLHRQCMTKIREMFNKVGCALEL